MECGAGPGAGGRRDSVCERTRVAGSGRDRVCRAGSDRALDGDAQAESQFLRTRQERRLKRASAKGGVNMAKRAKSGAAKPVPLPLSDFAEARGRWRAEVQEGLGGKA